MSEIRQVDGVTEEKCEKCRQWFDRRGIRLHRLHCDGVNDSAEDPPEPPVKETVESGDADTTPEKKRICPDCGSTQVATCADFYDEIREVAEERGTDVDLDRLQPLSNYDYVCRECQELFNTEDL